MNPTLALLILVAYFGLLISVSFYTARGADTTTFFTANRQSPWWLVAFGMIGTSLSGVTFISVPGAVGKIGFSYFQVVLGYIIGYLVIGTVLMPLYYRLNLISIYGYLEKRFGFWSYKAGAGFFLLARTVGSAVRLYVAANVLQLAIFNPLSIPSSYDFKGGLLYNTGDSCICYFNATHARRLDDNFCFAFSFLSSEPTVSELQIPYWAKPCRLDDPPHP